MLIYRIYKKLQIINRAKKIILVFFRAGFSYYIHHAGLYRLLPKKHQGKKTKNKTEDLPRCLRQTLEKLGPVFVKFGQILSTRWDLLPREFITELEKLQSTVPPFSFREAKKIIEKEFKKPLKIIFKKFDTTPFASASLGQVYKATLNSGEKVAVKVQRPGIKKQIKLDTEVLLLLANFVESKILSLKNYNLVGIVKEFRRWTLNELDYRKEATNCEIFSNFFKRNPHVYGPKVYWDYTTGSVLTLELINGTCLKEIINSKKITKKNKKLIAERGADSFVRQYFEYGFFHADPHPGNIFVLENNVLMFLDFGMVGWLDEKLTNLAAATFLALLQKDIEKLVKIFVQIEEDYDDRLKSLPIRQKLNINALRKDLNQLIGQWTDRGEPGKFTRLFYDVLNVAVQNNIGVPIDLIMLSKSIITLDAVATKLHPDFKLEQWERPMIEKIYLNKIKPKKIKTAIEDNTIIMENIIKKLPETTSRLMKKIEDPASSLLGTEQISAYENLFSHGQAIKNQSIIIVIIFIVSVWLWQSPGQINFGAWPLYKLGFALGIIMTIIYFINNLNKAKHYEKLS